MTTRILSTIGRVFARKLILLAGVLVLVLAGGAFALVQHSGTFGLRGTFTVLGDMAKRDGSGCFGAYWYLHRDATYIRPGSTVAVYEPDDAVTKVGALRDPVYQPDSGSCTFIIDVPRVHSGQPYYLIAVQGVPGQSRVTEPESRAGRIALDDSDARGRLRLNAER